MPVDRLLKLIAENIPLGLVWADNEGIIRLVNLEAEELLGRTRKGMCGFPADPFHPVLRILGESLESGQEVKDKEVRLKRGTTSVFGRLSTRVLCEEGVSYGVLGLLHDLTRERQMEVAVLRAENLAMLGQFAAGAVHEIRNPLTAIRGFIQLLQDQFQGTPKEAYLPIIIQEIDRINNIIRDLLQLARPVVPLRQPCRLGELVKQVSLLVEGEACLQGILVKTDIEDGLQEVFADPEQVKQVILNAVKNSLDAMTGGGNLLIRLRGGDGSWQCLEVHDDGVGISPEDMPHIFEPFFTTKSHGTGLGMAVSRKIVENHSGRMDIESRPGLGTVVTVLLPEEEG